MYMYLVAKAGADFSALDEKAPAGDAQIPEESNA
jgi:hypothetical protein